MKNAGTNEIILHVASEQIIWQWAMFWPAEGARTTLLKTTLILEYSARLQHRGTVELNRGIFYTSDRYKLTIN